MLNPICSEPCTCEPHDPRLAEWLQACALAAAAGPLVPSLPPPQSGPIRAAPADERQRPNRMALWFWL